MSHVAYDLQLSDAMNDLQEQVKVEAVPPEKYADGKAQNMEDDNDEMFQHLACLYIKYIDVYRKLEECYDQMVHPQKRIYIKKVLESTMLRICELKKDLSMCNPRHKSLYVHLDQLLFDLKYDPSIIEIPVPEYFKENDTIPVDVKLKPLKKKKGKKGKKSKKKGADDDDEEKKKNKTFDEKDHIVDTALDKHHQTKEPVYEIIHEMMTMDEMEIALAIRLIQRNERGRQGRFRIN